MEITLGDVLFGLMGLFGAALIYHTVSNWCEAVKDGRRQRRGKPSA